MGLRAKRSPKSRTPLTRERILDAAVEVIDADGLDGLSMRRLGSKLGVEAMSLYNHFPNKDALLEGVTGKLLSEVELPPVVDRDWESSMRVACTSFRAMLLNHPNAIPLIASKPEASPEAIRPVELSLSILKQAGFDAQGALHAHWAIVGYTIGHASFQIASAFSQPELAAEAIRMREQALDPGEFPCLFEILPLMSECDFDAGYEFGLDLLIAGLKAKLP